jgi:protein O-mannosyl-transferase
MILATRFGNGIVQCMRSRKGPERQSRGRFTAWPFGGDVPSDHAAPQKAPSAQTGPRPSRRDSAISIVLIALAALAVYHNTFSVPFLFDDSTSIVKDNPTIRHLWPVWRALAPPSGGLTVSARPLVNLSLAINYAISGMSVWSYHAFNLIIHILAGVTLFGVLRRTFLLPRLRGRFGRAHASLALGAALIWTVHPLQTESVTYVVQRAESLSGLFYLLTLYCVIRGAEASRPGIWYLAAVGSCLAGMASKEVMATAPLIVLLYDKVFLSGSFRSALRRRSGLYGALAATWGLLGWLAISAGGRGGTAGFEAGIVWWKYALTQFGAIVHYLRLSVFPHPLVLDYGRALVTRPIEIWPYAGLVLLLLASSVLALVRRPAAGFLGLWFFATLAPTSSVIPVATQTMAEHRMYLALAAVVVMAMASTYAWWDRLLVKRKSSGSGLRIVVPGVALAIVVALLGSATIARNRDYRSALSIWQDTVHNRPNNPRAHANLGETLTALGKTGDAVTEFNRALEIDPDFVEAHSNLGMILASLGRTEEAVSHYERALRINPNSAPAQYNLGMALAGMGRTEDAARHFERVLQIKPDFSDADYRLGVVLEGLGATTDAVKHYERAISLMPNNAGACNNLAWFLATREAERGGDPDRAVLLAQRACALTGDSIAVFLDTMAAAYAGAHRFPEAITAGRKALHLASSSGKEDLVRQIKARLEAYLAARAWIEPSEETAAPR